MRQAAPKCQIRIARARQRFGKMHETHMGKQDTTRKFNDEIIQVQRVQYPNVWIEAWRLATEVCAALGSEWRQLKHGKCDHGQDSQRRSNQWQNI